MLSRPLGLPAAEAYVVGGILGSGAFSVLGVVVLVAGRMAWATYLLAGVVALCSSYSYVRLNEASDANGGAVTLVLSRVGHAEFAGGVGWTLLTGFVGLVAVYGYAFGAYLLEFVGHRTAALGPVPARPLFSVLVVVAFVCVNWAGPTESGLVETTIVGVNVLLVAAFGVLGLLHVRRVAAGGLSAVPGRMPSVLVAAASAFVSLVAWQTLLYDQSRLRRPAATVREAVLTALPPAIVGYGLLSILVVSLVPRAEVARRPELVFVFAAAALSGPAVSVLVGLVALGATAAAVNALLFSTALFLDSMMSCELFPDAETDGESGEVPTTPLLLVGGVATTVAAAGRIDAVVEFSALAFTVANCVVSALALVDGRESVPWPVSLVGVAGTALFVCTTLWWLAGREPSVLAVVLVLALLVVAVEVLYFDREHPNPSES